MAYMDQVLIDPFPKGLRALTVWHRRAGKDQTWLNQVIKCMVQSPKCGTYPYIFPKLTQGRRDLWDAKGMNGTPFRAHFPPELVMDASETEMQITLKPMPHQNPMPISDGKGGRKYVGSVFQVMGTDKESLENLRGIEAAGVVFSEYSLQDPVAWTEIFEPVLLASGGWAAFDFTPKGENHAYDLYKAALLNPKWFVDLRTIEDTRQDAPGESGDRIITLEQIEDLRRRGVNEDTIQQEYYCSFRGHLHGTIYGDLLNRARSEGRIGRFPWIPTAPVGTCWDIGMSDHCAVWFYQMPGDGTIRFIDYYEEKNKEAPFYAQYLRENKRYQYARMCLPWDARFSTGAYFSNVGFRGIEFATIEKKQVGIDRVRENFSKFYFDEHNCALGLSHLENYSRVWDDERKVYLKEPKHDQHSHGADALRTGAKAEFGPLIFEGQVKNIQVVTQFDPRNDDMRGGW